MSDRTSMEERGKGGKGGRTVEIRRDDCTEAHSACRQESNDAREVSMNNGDVRRSVSHLKAGLPNSKPI